MSESKTEATPHKTTGTLVGRVVSSKMQKTIVVRVERQVKHALYGKYLWRSSKLKAHDENDQCQEGDLVAIEPCRPLSRDKHFRLVKILEKAQAPIADVAADAGVPAP